MTETAKAMMTDAEVMALHQAYIDKHKKAFRVAFDFLNKFFPPRRDPDWFREQVNPVWDGLLAEADEEGNNLTHRPLMEVYAYLDASAGKMEC